MPENTPPDELTMTVGAREIYDKVVSVDNKITGLIGQKLDARVTALERWRYAIAGSPVVTAVAYYFAQRGK